MSAAAVLLGASLALFAQSEPAPADLELVVLEAGEPVVGASLRVAGRELGTSDESGSIFAKIPSGRAQLVLEKGGEELVSLDLLTDEKEIVLIIATVREGREPELIIESSGTESVLAKERSGQTTTSTAPAAQPPGALEGTVTSVGDDGRPVEEAKVFFSGTQVRVVTDNRGHFEVELPAGTYSISVVHPRFSTQTVDNVRVIPGKRVSVGLELTPAGARLEDYVVTAPYIEGSVASTIGAQKEASGVTDVLGAAQMSAAGDSNAADALARVTGLTIEEGKYVLIRGQPPRYTLALFNGSPLPSPEPLLQVVPLDLFPTGVLKNIQVQKSFSPDAPGSFGGGLVQLNTRGVPEETFMTLSMGVGFNTQSAFASGDTYQGGSTDWLGIDDGTRALPAPVAEASQDGRVSLNTLPVDEQAALSAEFPNHLRTSENTLPPDFGVNLSGGTSLELGDDVTAGVLATLSYGNKWRNQQRIQRTFALQNGNLVSRADTLEDRTDNEVNLSGLLTLALDIGGEHRFASNTFIVNQNQQRTQLTTGLNNTEEDIQAFLLSWIERFLVAEQLTGAHDFGWLKIDYRGMIAQASRSAPDRREYEFRRTQEQDQFFVPDASGVTRNYSDVVDTAYSASMDISFDIIRDESSWIRPKVQTGARVSKKDRTAGEDRYQWVLNSSGDPADLDPESVFDPTQTGQTLVLRDNSILGADDYEGSTEVMGVYGLADIDLWSIVRLFGGVRYETARYDVRTFQAAGGMVTEISSGFEQEELLPAASLTVSPLEELLFRATYGKSLSRPVLNELSPAQYFDPDSGQQFQGEPDLLPTEIDAVDFRVEWYPSTTETLSVGYFYKSYANAIETTFVANGGSDNDIATLQNADGEVQGIELGGRFEGGRIRDLFGGPTELDNLYLLANLALLDSTVNLTETGIATSSTRPLQGQADLILNVQGGYDGPIHDLTIAFNLVGTRLARVGTNDQPDIYQSPIAQLDVVYGWEIFEGLNLKLAAENLLDAKVELTQQVEGGEPQVYRSFTRGMVFSAGLGWTFL